MKKFYKEVLRREGGKRNLTAADVSEVLRIAAEIIVDPKTSAYVEEFEKYLGKKKNETVKPALHKVVCFIGFRGLKAPSRRG